MAGMKKNVADSGMQRCPLCGGNEFGKPKGPKKNRCVECGSNERMRASWLLLSAFAGLGEGSRVLHLGPEVALARKLQETCGAGYEAWDLDAGPTHGQLDFIEVRRMDPLVDIARIEPSSYDAVVHNHVLPALACDYGVVLRHLHGLLKPGGLHVLSVPVGEGYYREDMDPSLLEGARRRKFGHPAHFRSFGSEDIERTLGAAIGVHLGGYRLDKLIDPETLLRYAIPERRWDVRGGTVLAVQRT